MSKNNPLFNDRGVLNISTSPSERPRKYNYDKKEDPTIEFCLNCTESKCSGVCTLLKCCTCEHRKWFGDLALHYCEINGKPIHRNSYCPKEKLK